MVKRVIVVFSDEELEKLTNYAKLNNISRNKLIQQICRMWVGLPSLLKEVETYEFGV